MRPVLLTLPAIALLACAGSTGYQAPQAPSAIQNRVVVARDIDSVWNALVAGIASSFFVINNLERDSGLINLSYSGDPEAYVDCGLVISKVSNLRGTRNYKIPAARASYEYEIMDVYLYNVSRQVKLEGRINLLVQAISSHQTSVLANTRYVLSVTSVTQQAGGTHPPTRMEQSVAFNTGGVGKFSGGTTCIPTGALENELLALLPNTALQRTPNSAFQFWFGTVLALKPGARSHSAALFAAAERPFRWAASRRGRVRDS